jgi:DNA-binding NarL/FixJ family response regulator
MREGDAPLETEKIRVLIADDLETHRRRFERIIEREPDMRTVYSAESGRDAVLNAAAAQPDIVLMDVEMEDKFAGISASMEISRLLPDAKIIILTVHDDDKSVFAAFKSGIVDYVVKTASDREIVEAIRAAHRNLSPIRPIIADKIRRAFQAISLREEKLLYIINYISTLSPSEFEVLRLLQEGRRPRQIAEARCVELGTIKKQINSILKKADKKRTRELIAEIEEMHIFELLTDLHRT